MSVELGYSSATGVSELVSRTDTGALRVPGRHAGAMYSVTHRLTAFREDGTPVGGAAGSLTFTPDQDYYFVQYPEADGDGNSVEKLSSARAFSGTGTVVSRIPCEGNGGKRGGPVSRLRADPRGRGGIVGHRRPDTCGEVNGLATMNCCSFRH